MRGGEKEELTDKMGELERKKKRDGVGSVSRELEETRKREIYYEKSK